MIPWIEMMASELGVRRAPTAPLTVYIDQHSPFIPLSSGPRAYREPLSDDGLAACLVEAQPRRSALV